MEYYTRICGFHNFHFICKCCKTSTRCLRGTGKFPNLIYSGRPFSNYIRTLISVQSCSIE